MTLLDELFPDVRSEDEVVAAIQRDRDRTRERLREKYARNPAAYAERGRRARAKNPGKHKQYHRDWYLANREYHLDASKKWQKANPEKVRNIKLKHKFGITTAERDAMFAAQGFACAICRTTDPGSKTGWHVDHDHDTNEVRSVLCHHCNAMVGYAKDNPGTLRAGAEYLERFR